MFVGKPPRNSARVEGCLVYFLVNFLVAFVFVPCLCIYLSMFVGKPPKNSAINKMILLVPMDKLVHSQKRNKTLHGLSEGLGVQWPKTSVCWQALARFPAAYPRGNGRVGRAQELGLQQPLVFFIYFGINT